MNNVLLTSYHHCDGLQKRGQCIVIDMVPPKGEMEGEAEGEEDGHEDHEGEDELLEDHDGELDVHAHCRKPRQLKGETKPTKEDSSYLEKLVEVDVFAVIETKDEAEDCEADDKHFKDVFKEGKVSFWALSNEFQQFSNNEDEEKEDGGVEKGKESKKREE